MIGKLGRMGHGELKGIRPINCRLRRTVLVAAWAHLLSKTTLKKTSKLLREDCFQCNQMPSYQETPAILSACLVSTEPEASLRIFPSSFDHDERFGQGAKLCPLSTPQDVSVSHILVFPTSASVQVCPTSSASQSRVPAAFS